MTTIPNEVTQLLLDTDGQLFLQYLDPTMLFRFRLVCKAWSCLPFESRDADRIRKITNGPLKEASNFWADMVGKKDMLSMISFVKILSRGKSGPRNERFWHDNITALFSIPFPELWDEYANDNTMSMMLWIHDKLRDNHISTEADYFNLIIHRSIYDDEPKWILCEEYFWNKRSGHRNQYLYESTLVYQATARGVFRQNYFNNSRSSNMFPPTEYVLTFLAAVFDDPLEPKKEFRKVVVQLGAPILKHMLRKNDGSRVDIRSYKFAAACCHRLNVDEDLSTKLICHKSNVYVELH